MGLICSVIYLLSDGQCFSCYPFLMIYKVRRLALCLAYNFSVISTLNTEEENYAIFLLVCEPWLSGPRNFSTIFSILSCNSKQSSALAEVCVLQALSSLCVSDEFNSEIWGWMLITFSAAIGRFNKLLQYAAIGQFSNTASTNVLS